MGRDSLDEKYGEEYKRTRENRRTIRIPDILWDEIPKPKSDFIRNSLAKMVYRHDEMNKLIEFLQEHYEKAKSKKWNYNPRAKFWKKLEAFF